MEVVAHEEQENNEDECETEQERQIRSQPIYLVVRRKMQSIFVESTPSTSVLELKKDIEGILKIDISELKLFIRINDDLKEMENDKLLMSYGISSAISNPYTPVFIIMTKKLPTGEFEPTAFTPYSVPPEFPDVMKMVVQPDKEESEIIDQDAEMKESVDMSNRNAPNLN